MKLHVFQGRDGWRWHLHARNGKVIATSGEAFDSHGNAARAARRMHKLLTTAQAVHLVDDARH